MVAVPEANELGTKTKRGHRAGVQAEGFRFRQKGGEVVAGMGGQVARASRLVTISECDVMLDVKHCRTVSETSVASSLATKGKPANEADTLGE